MLKISQNEEIRMRNKIVAKRLRKAAKTLKYLAEEINDQGHSFSIPANDYVLSLASRELSERVDLSPQLLRLTSQSVGALEVLPLSAPLLQELLRILPECKQDASLSILILLSPSDSNNLPQTNKENSDQTTTNSPHNQTLSN